MQNLSVRFKFQIYQLHCAKVLFEKHVTVIAVGEVNFCAFHVTWAHTSKRTSQTALRDKQPMTISSHSLPEIPLDV